MTQIPRHQCLIYTASPAVHLPQLAMLIQHRLTDNYRCLYLHSPVMVAGIRPYLVAAGVDVMSESRRGRLVLSSDTSHLVDGRFESDRMLNTLQQALDRALEDGCRGLFATGDMSWEFGSARDFSQLREYERRLEDFFQAHPALYGICQYNAEDLPREVMRHGLVTHPGIYLNATQSRLNPFFVDQNSLAAHAYTNDTLDQALKQLFTVPDALLTAQ